ncbi:hypothetical protein HOY82DRAFT_628485, partial [Tuber indicum]
RFPLLILLAPAAFGIATDIYKTTTQVYIPIKTVLPFTPADPLPLIRKAGIKRQEKKNMARHSIGPWALCRAYLLVNILLPSIQVNKGLLSTLAETTDNLPFNPTNETCDPSGETTSTITNTPADTSYGQNFAPSVNGPLIYRREELDPVYHNVSGFAIENVEICKSRPFALTQENYLRSGADEWLREYTMDNQNRNYMQKHGVISTIAYDFLGNTNFKCAIGFQHLCNVECLTVVTHVEDLRLARQVYFVLASASHYVSALTVVHDALVSAQSTAGLLSGKMATTFFFTGPDADEALRARTYKVLMEGTLWAAQTAMNSILPMIPWSKLNELVSDKLETLKKKEHVDLEEYGSGTYAPFDVTRYYGDRSGSTLYSAANAKTVSEIFKDEDMGEIFVDEGIRQEDVLYYIDNSKPVTGPHLWQVVQHLAETSHDRVNPEHRADNSEQEAEQKNGKNGRTSRLRRHSEDMKEYREWERKKKNQLFDEMMGVEPLRIGVPDFYRFKLEELQAQFQNPGSGEHSRTFGPGQKVMNKAAAIFEVAKHSPPGARTATTWGDTVRVAWGSFKSMCSSSWNKAKNGMRWIGYQPRPYMVSSFRETGLDDRQSELVINGIQGIIEENPNRLIREFDDEGNPIVPATPGIPIRRQSYEEYLHQRDAKKREKGEKRGKEEKGKQVQKDGDQEEQSSEPRIKSLGPVHKVPYHRDRGAAFNDFKMDITALLHPVLNTDFTPEKERRRRLSWQEKATRAEQMLRSFYPSLQTAAVDAAVKMMFSSWEANDPSKEHNEMNLQYVIQESSGLARKGLKETANRVFGAPDPGSDGDSDIADLMAAGSLLPVSDGSMSMVITKAVISRAINAALKSQKIYVSCTQDLLHFEGKNSPGIQVQDCELDNSGPQNLKACIGGAVCYIYRWNDRPLIMGHHNEEPFGLGRIAQTPWNIDVQGIIVSSFLSKINNKGSSQLGDDNASFVNSGPNADTAINTSAAGVFTIPVCLAPKNWNTQTKDYWIGNDVDPYAPVKALPCYCGDLGEDTGEIWHDTGLMYSGAQRTYTHTNCPNQFKKRLPDWLERYVAMCSLSIHKAKIGGKIKTGKHRLCDIVERELKGAGIQTVTQLDKEVRYALKCKIKRKKSRGCEKYYRTPISSVWAETQPVILERVEEELRQKGQSTVPVVDGFTQEELRKWEWGLMEIEGMRGEFREMDRIQSEYHIDIRTLPGNVPASVIESHLKDFYDEVDEGEAFGGEEVGRDEDIEWGEGEEWNGEPETWDDYEYF